MGSCRPARNVVSSERNSKPGGAIATRAPSYAGRHGEPPAASIDRIAAVPLADMATLTRLESAGSRTWAPAPAPRVPQDRPHALLARGPAQGVAGTGRLGRAFDPAPSEVEALEGVAVLRGPGGSRARRWTGHRGLARDPHHVASAALFRVGGPAAPPGRGVFLARRARRAGPWGYATGRQRPR
ncbi:DUF6211 family protein [Streptomyces sp. CB02923]|uniref:DUF6211 family protein n=1 Tax=Streptomyces sp. CB02923 TaxID=1718985 RepID=UPI003FD4C767